MLNGKLSSGTLLEKPSYTAEYQLEIFNKVNSDMLKVTMNAFLLIKHLNTITSTTIDMLSSDQIDGLHIASWYWEPPNDAALLFPENFPSWEQDGERYVHVDRYSIYLTHYGEIALDRMQKYIENSC